MELQKRYKILAWALGLIAATLLWVAASCKHRPFFESEAKAQDHSSDSTDAQIDACPRTDAVCVGHVLAKAITRSAMGGNGNGTSCRSANVIYRCRELAETTKCRFDLNVYDYNKFALQAVSIASGNIIEIKTFDTCLSMTGPRETCEIAMREVGACN